jgi:hypothetical protein
MLLSRPRRTDLRHSPSSSCRRRQYSSRSRSGGDTSATRGKRCFCWMALK